MATRWSHKPKIAGSNPVSATNFHPPVCLVYGAFLCAIIEKTQRIKTMADTVVTAGRVYNFAGGSGNTLTFTLDNRIPGFQASVQGFDLSAATVTYIPWGTTQSETITMTGLKKSASFADAVNLIRAQSVTFGGLAAGTYRIGVTQLAI